MFFNKKIETMAREDLKKLQAERLRKTVERVYNNVPLYRERFDEYGIKPEHIKTVDDLKNLPFTYKTDLRDTYPYGLFAAPMRDVVRIHASSGTTGKQTVVGYTKNDIDVWAECVARAMVSVGGSSEDIVHVSYGYGLFTGGLGLHEGATKLGAAVVPVSTGNTARQINIFKDFGSTILCCTPSYAMYLAEAVKESGISPDELKLRIGIFGAEPWTEEMRQEIEKGLGIKAYDIYGLSEVCGPGVACNCYMQNGLHVQEDHFIPEIIDPDTGEVLPEGESGELVFTCITKEALPLIRYRTRDISSLIYEPCECGRTTVRMTKPCGRTDDMLIIRGVNVFPSQVESVLLNIEGVSPHYHITVDRVNNLDTMEVQVEMSPSLFSDSVKVIQEKEKTIKQALLSTLNISVGVKLVSPKTISRSEGKANRVTDNRKNR
ncbi:MAG: phenylacetate--CoA ligase [Clostridia bacterium]|nr:phenylacetate--CoA ligase [Clostridia bacterium]MBQ6171389.1 phenylacetate--CoA ligase [Clostridia bacterium]